MDACTRNAIRTALTNMLAGKIPDERFGICMNLRIALEDAGHLDIADYACTKFMRDSLGAWPSRKPAHIPDFEWDKEDYPIEGSAARYAEGKKAGTLWAPGSRRWELLEFLLNRLDSPAEAPSSPAKPFPRDRGTLPPAGFPARDVGPFSALLD